MKKSLLTVILSLIILMNISLFLNTEKVYAASEEALITEWTLPVDADGTTGGGTTIKLPIPYNSKNAYTVDWGDGRKQTFDSTADFPTHTYKNTVETTYTIQITGTVSTFGYNSISTPTATNSHKNYYTFTKYLTGLISWGELEATRYGFSMCKKLSSSIPIPTENSFKNVSNFINLFYLCNNLSGDIPANLFANTPNVTSFDSTFYGCSSLSGSIPAQLFANTPNVTNFEYTFLACSGLSGSIPEELFANTPNVTTFRSTFSDCSGLSGSISGELFANTPNVTNFGSTFYKCSGLSGSIPEDLFSNTPNVTELSSTFHRCSGLSGSIPGELFANTPNVTGFSYTFIGCSGLSGSIPAELFANTPKVTSFACTFYECEGLSGSIPEELFANTPNVTELSSTFHRCSGLSGSIPGELFANTPNVTSFYSTFYGCSGLSGSIPAELFANTPNVTDFYHTFNGCSNLSGNIPANLFANTPNVTTFEYTFNGCSGLSGSIPVELFANTPNVTNFGSTFSGCSGLSSIPAGLFENNTGITTNTSQYNGYAQTFSGCSGLKSAVIDSKYVGYRMFYSCNKLVDITITDNVEGIYGAGSFRATSSYSSTNLLLTNLDTSNEIALAYDWASDYRTLELEGLTEKIEVEYISKALITEWTIPAGGTTILLPIPSNWSNSYSYTVDWGDGTSNTYDNTANFPEHVYTNTNTTIYTIQITGSVYSFGYTSMFAPTATNSYKDYYTFTQYLTGLISWGELEATRYGFSYCKNLSSSIPIPTENSFKNVTSFSYTFYSCSGLSGSIPGELFANTPNVTGFDCAFYSCSSLSGNIPANLFANTPNVKAFYHTFDGCSGLSGSIPGELFTNTPNVTNFRATFQNCSGLSGSIPEELFANTPNVTTFEYTFGDCSGLSGSIPEELFANTPNVTSFGSTFSNCSGLSGSIPVELFANTPNVTTFEYTFFGCSGLSGSIPEGLFANTPSVTDFGRTFEGCSGLSGNIPANLFANTPNVTNFFGTFDRCSSLRGSIPVELFANTPNVKGFSSTFYGCSGLSGSIPEGLFANTPNVTSFSSTFSGCSGLSGSIPAELFANTPNVTNFFGTFNRCSSLSGSIPGELFANTPNVTDFGYTFNNCSGLSGSIPAELFANTPKVTNFGYTFSYCSGLSGSIPGELFANCPNVTDFGNTFLQCIGFNGSIPAGLFENNTGITTNTSKYFGYAKTFYGCSGLKSAVIDSKYVGYQMFYGCNNLVDITITNNVEEIYGAGSFRATSPYSSTNLLLTNLDTSNDIALNYNWLGDYRSFNIDYNLTYVFESETYTYDGNEKKPSVTNVVRNGVALVEGTDYTVNYKDNIGAGTATVLIAGMGIYGGEAEVGNFTILPRDLLITAKDQTITYGENISTDVSMVTAETLAEGHTISSIVLTPSIVNVGTGTITPSDISVVEDVYEIMHNYNISYSNGVLTIIPYDLANATIAAIVDQPHTGSTITPVPVATVPIPSGSTTTLVEDTDYTVEYSNNINVGTATVTLTGKGNYTGTKSANFIIIDIIAPTGTFSPTGTEYTDDANYTVKISVTASDENGIKKVVISGTCEGTDLAKDGVYNSSTGAYEATFKLSEVCDVSDDGVGEYTFDADIFDTSDNICEVGTYVVTYESMLGDLPITPSNYESEYDGTSHGINLSGIDLTDATIVYGTSAGNYNLTEEPKYTNVGEYTVYYKISKRRYNDYEGSTKIIITPKKVKINWGELELQYNGKAQTPTATIDSGVAGETIILSVTGSGTDLGTYIAKAKIESVEGGQADVNNYVLEKNDNALNE